MIPKGQKTRADFPRFGLTPYAQRFPARPKDLSIAIQINENHKVDISDALKALPRTKQRSDFHCVTTWTYRDANWGGVRFTDFFRKHVESSAERGQHIAGAVFFAQDGYRTTLLLEDLLGDNVLLADTLDGQPLSIEHGAPLRLVMPEHYAYKSVKHLKKIAFYSNMPVVKRGMLAFLDHPRARVRKEERGRWIPGWILRYVYRPLIPGTVKKFSDAMQKHASDKGRNDGAA